MELKGNDDGQCDANYKDEEDDDYDDYGPSAARVGSSPESKGVYVWVSECVCVL